MQIPFELQALSGAREYQRWIYQAVAPHLGKRILELGSGIGNLSSWLPDRELLVLSEVDPNLISILRTNPEVQNKKNTQIMHLNLEQNFGQQLAPFDLDTIVSFNVMEHVENDRSAFQDQVLALKNSRAKGPKRIVSFVPAHPLAFGSFDRIFQHYRRYNKKMLKEHFSKIDPEIDLHMHYFNALSLPAWIIQGRLLQKTKLNSSQVKLLDRIIPYWKPLDFLLLNVLKLPFGQSLVCVATIE